MTASTVDEAAVPTAQPKRLTRKTVEGQLNSARQLNDDKSDVSRMTNPPRNISTVDNSDITKQEERERLVSVSKVQDQAYILGGRNLSPSKNSNNQQLDQKNGESAALGDAANTAYTILEPLRTDPIEEYKVRQRRLERVPAEGIPEIHFIGQIKSCIDVITDSSEGVSIR